MNMTVSIKHTEWADGKWLVVVFVETTSGSYSGPHVLDLPEDASDEDLEAAIVALYG
jgi:hypothetical protein